MKLRRAFPDLTCLLALPLALGLTACPGDDGGNDEVAADTSDGPTDDDTTTDDGTSESTSTGDTTEDTTTDDTTEESTSDTSDTESTEDTTTDDTTEEDTGPEDFSMYSAQAFPGGLDRIVITRVNFNETTCTEMVLVSPVMFDEFEVDIPDQWRIEEVRAWDDTLECPEDKSNPDSTAGGGMGEITFQGYDAFQLYPCAMGFDMEMYMSTEPPSSKLWITDSVEVEGVNCG